MVLDSYSKSLIAQVGILEYDFSYLQIDSLVCSRGSIQKRVVVPPLGQKVIHGFSPQPGRGHFTVVVWIGKVSAL